MKGFNIAEQGHVVNALPPISLNSGKTSDYWCMANYAHASIIVTLGAAVAATTLTVYQSEDNAGAGEDAIAFRYYSETSAAGDVLDRQADAADTGFASASAGTANTMHVIEVDASELAEGHPYMCVKASDPSGAQLGAVIVVLSGARYQAEPTMSALA